MSQEVLLEFQGVTKSYRDFFLRRRKPALENLDLQIRAGEIVGLLGPNGSGKSTAISLAVGLLGVDSGKLTLFGGNPKHAKFRQGLAFLPEENANYPGLSARQNLQLHARLIGMEADATKARVNELLSRVGLSESADRRTSTYSKGMGRRLGLAVCLLGSPRLMILDEPTSGLDPLGTELVRDILVECRNQGCGVLLSSHLLSEIEGVCDRIVVLNQGQVICQGNAQDLLIDRTHHSLCIDALDASTESALRNFFAECGIAVKSIAPASKSLAQLYREIFVSDSKSIKADTK